MAIPSIPSIPSIRGSGSAPPAAPLGSYLPSGNERGAAAGGAGQDGGAAVAGPARFRSTWNERERERERERDLRGNEFNEDGQHQSPFRAATEDAVLALPLKCVRSRRKKINQSGRVGDPTAPTKSFEIERLDFTKSSSLGEIAVAVFHCVFSASSATIGYIIRERLKKDH